MIFSVVIPTLGTRNTEFIRLLKSLNDQTYKGLEIIVVSQDNHKGVAGSLEIFRQDLNIKHIELSKKGLSFSRNQGIPQISGQIVTFSDDDCWYPPEAFETVKKSIEKAPTSDVICFQIYDPERKEYYKTYPGTVIDNLKIRQVLQRSSIEIFIRLNKINKDELLFNEHFGLGAIYPSGEENIMLTNLYKKGFRLTYFNQVVVFHAKPSQKSRLNFTSFKSKGPLFKEIFGTGLGFFMLTFLFLKKFKSLDQPFTYYFEAIKEMLAYKK